MDFEDGVVTLKPRQGAIIRVPIEKLSPKDREFIQSSERPEGIGGGFF